MAREQIQINDLEPSIIGEDVTRYAIQIRGVDGNGNEGPWSTILEYESPELLPSLQSSNYVEGEAGWFLDNDGTFEVNDGLIRGTLQSANYIPNTSGWALDVGGNVEFSSGLFRGALQIGQNTFNVDSNGNLFIGGSTFNNSPFAVNTNGQIQAMAISAGFITAGQLQAGVVYAGTIIANQIISGTINGQRIPNLDASKITEGQFDAVRIPNLEASIITSGTFEAVHIPNLNANKIIAGTLGADVVYAGSISADQISGGTIDGVFITGASISGTTITSPTNIVATGYAVGSNNQSLYSLACTINQSLVVGSLTSTNTLRVRSLPSGAGTNIVATSNGTFRFQSSSIRYKENIRNADKMENLLEINPVLFDYKKTSCGEERDFSQMNIYGLIAEDVHDLGLNSLLYYSEDKPESVSYDRIGLALIPYVKELYDRIDELERKVNGS